MIEGRDDAPTRAYDLEERSALFGEAVRLCEEGSRYPGDASSD